MGNKGSSFGHIDANEFSSWMTPADALDLVFSQMGDKYAAAHELVSRLGDGLIISAAGNVVVSPAYDVELQDMSVLVIPNHWRALGGNALGQMFWKTGTIEVWVDRGNTRVTYYNLRFDPAAVGQVVPKPSQARPALDASSESLEPEQKGPPVPRAALEAWFKAYQSAFPASQDTEAKALESARGCFPGKSVSRDAVRALRGNQKRGRKPDSAN